MCLFENFELYTSEPRIKATYYLEGETEQAYHQRQQQQQREEQIGRASCRERV